MFLAVARDDLHDDKPVGQRRLDRQIHGSLNAASQFRHHAEVAQHFPDHRKTDDLWPGLQELLASEKNLEGLCPLGKPALDVESGTLFPPFLAQTNFCQEQFHAQFGLLPKFGMPRQEFFDQGTFSGPPPLGHFLGQTLHKSLFFLRLAKCSET
jgi:hypothetical protein